MERLLIGYRAQYTYRVPEWLRTSGAEEVGCVVNHMVRASDLPVPEFWPHQNRHNAVRLFDSEEIAWTVLRDDLQILLERDESKDPPWRAELVRLPVEEFDLYAFKVLPVCFVEENRDDLKLPASKVAPMPGDYARLGYDAVGWNKWGPFACSPLICNFEANQRKVNRYCLFDELEPAMELAKRYSGTGWQAVWPNSGHCAHSPYCVVEVWRKAKPFAEPPRQGARFKWPADLLHRLVQHKLGHGGVFER